MNEFDFNGSYGSNPLIDPVMDFFYGADPIILFLATIALSLLILVGLNVSGKFKSAIDGLIEANPTTISNPVIFQVLGIIFFIAVTVFLIVSLSTLVQIIEYDGFGSYVFFDLLGTVLTVGFGYAFTSLYFSPERINLTVDKSSSTAEDLIALLSFGLKAPLSLVKMISNLYIVLGSLSMLSGVISLFSGYDYSGFLYFSGGLVNLAVGAFLPFIFYMLFLFLYPIYNFWLAILHIPKIGKQ